MGEKTQKMGKAERGLYVCFFECIKDSHDLQVTVKESRGAFAKKWPAASRLVTTYREIEVSIHV